MLAYWAQSYQQKNYQNSDKILRILKISSDFQNVFLTKYFVLKFLGFSEKIGGFKIFRFLSENFSELRFLLIGLSPGVIAQSLNPEGSKYNYHLNLFS